ncbi:hypothetical protein KC968_03785 [Candidatus Saccharibacteria bacterium]|nr:hypothetical protein [Candidatus Saccharibacteria bacterium]
MPKKQKSTIDTTASATYYTGRVIQRVCLFLAVATSILSYLVTVSIAHTQMVYSVIQYKFVDNMGAITFHESEINTYKYFAITAAVVAIAVTIAFYAIPRVKKYDKRLIIDSLVVAVGCVAIIVLQAPIIRFFLAQI